MRHVYIAYIWFTNGANHVYHHNIGNNGKSPLYMFMGFMSICWINERGDLQKVLQWSKRWLVGIKWHMRIYEFAIACLTAPQSDERWHDLQHAA